MKPTRRGFVGLVGGVVGAAVAGVKLTPAEAGVVKGAAKELHTIAPTFKIDTRTGPPWAVGDVVKKVDSGQMFFIREAQLARVRNNTIFGTRGTGINVIEREAEPGSRVYKQGGMPGLVLVPFMSPESGQVIPLHLIRDGEIVRIGRAYNEAGTKP